MYPEDRLIKLLPVCPKCGEAPVHTHIFAGEEIVACPHAGMSGFDHAGAAGETIALAADAYRRDVRRLRPRFQTIDLNKCQALCERLLSPEDLGHAVTAEVRDLAREALGLPKVETSRNQHGFVVRPQRQDVRSPCDGEASFGGTD